MYFVQEQTTTRQFVMYWFDRGLDKRCDWVNSYVVFGDVDENESRKVKRLEALRVIQNQTTPGE